MGDDFGVFWNMVWQEKVCKIVMLTNLIEQRVSFQNFVVCLFD
jgi:protein tyrosine phosphatase